jgi:hypothetical protein
MEAPQCSDRAAGDSAEQYEIQGYGNEHGQERRTRPADDVVNASHL